MIQIVVALMAAAFAAGVVHAIAAVRAVRNDPGARALRTVRAEVVSARHKA